MKAQLLALILLLCISPVRLYSQQVGSDGRLAGPVEPLPPAEPGKNTTTSSLPDAQHADPAQVEPDTHTLSSAETFGLGSLRKLGNAFDPSLQFEEYGSTGTATNTLDSVTSLGLGLDFSRSSDRGQLGLLYNGAANLYRGASSYNQQDHNFGISQRTSFGRWTLRMGDSFVFASQGGTFGGMDTGGLLFGSEQGSLPGLQPGLLSSQTILTGFAKRISDVAYAEASYSLSRRTSVTVTGSYSLLHFLASGYVDSRQANGIIGYNYVLGPKSSVGVSYNYARIGFPGSAQRLQLDSMQMSYGRKVVGELALRIGGGPTLQDFRDYGVFSGRRLSWNAYSSLTYASRRTTYALTYFHGITAGSGVFFGSDSNLVTASAGRTLTRYWNASLNAGYARNTALVSSATFSNSFDNWYTNAYLSRPLGRQIQFGLSYGFQQQWNGSGSCPVASCGITPVRQSFSLNLSWHPLAQRR